MHYVFALSAIILLHTPDGREVWIDPEQVTSMHEGKDQVSSKVKCVINLTDGKFVSVVEECSYVVNKAIQNRGGTTNETDGDPVVNPSPR
jgi:hypothetical protein